VSTKSTYNPAAGGSGIGLILGAMAALALLPFAAPWLVRRKAVERNGLFGLRSAIAALSVIGWIITAIVVGGVPILPILSPLVALIAGYLAGTWYSAHNGVPVGAKEYAGVYRALCKRNRRGLMVLTALVFPGIAVMLDMLTGTGFSRPIGTVAALALMVQGVLVSRRIVKTEANAVADYRKWAPLAAAICKRDTTDDLERLGIEIVPLPDGTVLVGPTPRSIYAEGLEPVADRCFDYSGGFYEVVSMYPPGVEHGGILIAPVTDESAERRAEVASSDGAFVGTAESVAHDGDAVQVLDEIRLDGAPVSMVKAAPASTGFFDDGE